jgi:hypothetical protein
MQLDWQFLVDYGHIVIASSVLIAWLIKPFIISGLLAFFGFSKRVAFKSSLVLSQISEFTILVCLAAGMASGTLGTVVAVFIATVAISSILFEHSLTLSKHIKVKWWEKNQLEKEYKTREAQPEIILFGAHRLGWGLISNLRQISQNILVIDNDPSVINKLQDKKIPCIFGDAGEADLIETLDLRSLRMIVSTIPELDTNLFLLQFLKRRRKADVRIFLANHKYEAKQLYAQGATYVILPHYLGKKVVGEILEKRGFRKTAYQKLPGWQT